MPDPNTEHPKKRLPTWAPLLVLAIAPFLYPGIPFLASGSLLAADLHGHFRPIEEMYRWHMIRGCIPLWNPYAFVGWPTFASGEVAGFYLPSALPVLALGATLGLKIRLLLHLAMSGVGFYVLLREFRLARLLALLLALNYLFAGHTVTKAFLIPIGDIAAWVPWAVWFHLRFARRPTTGRWLAAAVGGGIMLSLFVPQIVIPTCIITACAGAACFVRIGTNGKRPSSLAQWIDRLALPIAEIGILALMARYPRAGWRNAFTGMGAAGWGLVGLLPLLWITWIASRRVRLRIHWVRALRWALGFAAAWLIAATLAGPQLGITAEAVPHSTQADLHYTKADFFTGAQAYGCLQHFLETVTLCRMKETVNNIALGPGIVALILAGVVLGFHRRRKTFLYAYLAALIVALVYFAAPGTLDLLVRLPFFSKFKGLARYLVFLNFFLFLIAALSARMAPRILHGRLRRTATLGVGLVLTVNLAFLLSHTQRYLERISGAEAHSIPEPVMRQIRAGLAPGELFLLDHRGFDGETTYLMDSIGNRVRGIPNYDPMRLRGYDAYLAAHNRSLGVNHDDYRKPLFEPVPTNWTRALRAHLYVFPPNAPKGAIRDAAQPVAGAPDWRIWRDPASFPAAWVEDDIQNAEPSPIASPGFQIERTQHSLHRIELHARHAQPGAWLVYPEPDYPGWRAWVDGEPVETRAAYGFLRAVPIRSPFATVTMEYRPFGFRAGWAALLIGIAVSVAIALETDRRRSGQSPTTPQCLAGCVAGAAFLAALVGARIFFVVPDSLAQRLAELAVVLVISLIWTRVVLRNTGSAKTTPRP